MSEIRDKVLGIERKTLSKQPEVSSLTAKSVWKVSRKGCGTSIFNGQTVAQLLDAEGKKKAENGERHFCRGDCEFERCAEKTL